MPSVTTVPPAQIPSTPQRTGSTGVNAQLQHNYVVYPGSSLANMAKDPFMQAFWPQVEGHTTSAADTSNTSPPSWKGSYYYYPGQGKLGANYDEAFDTTEASGAGLTAPPSAGLGIAVSSQKDLDAIVAKLKAKYGGAADNVGTDQTTLDVKDSADPGDRTFPEFKRVMNDIDVKTGLDGKPIFAGNFSAWVTMERTLDGKGIEATRDVVRPHLQPGKLPTSIKSVSYALNAEDRQDLGALLDACGYKKQMEGTTEVWRPSRKGTVIRIDPSEDPKVQGIIQRTYALDPATLRKARAQFADHDGAIRRDFGDGVSLEIPRGQNEATERFQLPPSDPPAGPLDSFGP